MTNIRLAAKAGLSAPSCLRRVRALEEDGYILGYHAEVDPARLNFKEMFFALVGLSSQAQGVLQEFEKQVAGWPEVRECHMIRGGGDFLLKIIARDKERRDALTMRLTSADNVIKVTTLETIRTSKSRVGVPVGSPPTDA